MDIRKYLFLIIYYKISLYKIKKLETIDINMYRI